MQPEEHCQDQKNNADRDLDWADRQEPDYLSCRYGERAMSDVGRAGAEEDRQRFCARRHEEAG